MSMFTCTFPHTSCYAASLFSCTFPHTSCYAASMFSCTFPHTSCCAASMFSCTFPHTSCYAASIRTICGEEARQPWDCPCSYWYHRQCLENDQKNVAKFLDNQRCQTARLLESKKKWQHIWAWQWRWENSTCHDLSQLTASTFLKNLKWRKKRPATVVLTKMTPKWDPKIWGESRKQSTWKWHKMLVFVGQNEASTFRPN